LLCLLLPSRSFVSQVGCTCLLASLMLSKILRSERAGSTSLIPFDHTMHDMLITEQENQLKICVYASNTCTSQHVHHNIGVRCSLRCSSVGFVVEGVELGQKYSTDLDRLTSPLTALRRFFCNISLALLAWTLSFA
jgi:hypothetical protein